MKELKRRSAKIERKTAETKIKATLVVDGNGTSTIQTGIPFFDHMLTLFTKHGLFDIELESNGDISVDFHHTVEDVGIVLGQAFKEALGDKSGMVRYGHFLLPMDETLVRVALDFSGRPLLVFRVPPPPFPDLNTVHAGQFPGQLVVEFLRGFAQQAGLTLHVEVFYSSETHHMLEAIFKGLARALEGAVRRDERIVGVPSTKGML